MDAMIAHVTYDGFVGSEEYAKIKAGLTAEDACQILNHFNWRSSLERALKDVSDLLKETQGIDFMAYIDPEKTKPYEKDNLYFY